MSRSCITDKGSGMQPPKPTSEWFNGKYRVTPETSRLLQEAVFKDGGGWGNAFGKDIRKGCTHIFVQSNGVMTYISDGDEEYFIECSGLPEKQPPQPTKVVPVKVEPQGKKGLIVGKWYKCVESCAGFLVLGRWYEILQLSTEQPTCKIKGIEDAAWFNLTRFDLNSESDYDPDTATFNVGDKVEVTSNMSNGNTEKPTFLTSWLIGDIVKIIAVCRNGKYTSFKCNKDGCDYSQELSQYQLKKVVDTEVKESKIETVVKVSIDRGDLLQHKHIGNIATTNNVDEVGINWAFPLCPVPNNQMIFSITKEDVNMSTNNRVVSVKFFDDDAGLKAEYSLVAEYQVTTRVSDQMTISKVLLTEDVAGDIELHNGIRANTVDLHILKQTGNKVMLQPVEFEDLRVEVRQV